MPATYNIFYNDLLRKQRADGKGSLSARTVRYIHTIVKAALKQAEKEQIIYRNPANATVPPNQMKNEVVPFTREEITRFLNAVKDDRLFTAYYLAFKTGLRCGEILGLR